MRRGQAHFDSREREKPTSGLSRIKLTRFSEDNAEKPRLRKFRVAGRCFVTDSDHMEEECLIDAGPAKAKIEKSAEHGGFQVNKVDNL